MGGGGGPERGEVALNLKAAQRTSPQDPAPDIMQPAARSPGAGRKQASCGSSIQNIAALRYVYNKRLRDKPGLKGKVTIHFAIDEFGKVIFAKVVIRPSAMMNSKRTFPIK